MSNMNAARYKMFRALLVFFAVLAVSATTAVFAADVYPSKPVRLIVPYPPGTIGDTVSRQIAYKLSGRLGKQVIVENRAGATGIIGMEAAAKAAPDGYTLVLVQDAQTILPAFQKMSYDLIKDFTPIAKNSRTWYLLSVHPSVPANSLKEFIALAKQKPGQLIWATAGINGAMHLAGELLRMKAGIDFKIVHFKGGSPMITDVLGGHSQAILCSTTTCMSHYQSGRLKALAICGPERTALLPNVPTTAEEGAPWLQAGQWLGFLAPAGTPRPIVDRLSNELKTILASDEVKKWFVGRGMEVAYQGPTEFGMFLKEEIERWADIVKKANLKQE